MKKSIIIFILFILFTSCQQALDKNDLSAITSDLVWTDYRMARAYMDDVAALSLPDWPVVEDTYCDEGVPNKIKNATVSYGVAIAGNDFGVNWKSSYTSIRTINVFIDKMQKSPIDSTLKAGLLGQAYFWRAYNYFSLVRVYGGVPYIKIAQLPTDSLSVPRNKTSECFSFMVEDLNKAIKMLPEKYTLDEAGKINKAVAYAFKGRILLYRASPQFNPTNQPGYTYQNNLWQEAYNANKEAYDWLVSKGYGLYPDFANLWFDELNKEDIFVTRYNNPEKTTARAKSCRPNSEVAPGQGTIVDRPTQELVEAFPMKDGLSIKNNPAYNLTSYWLNRDPRFYATIVYNGSLWELSGKTGRIQWTYVGYNPDGYLQTYGTLTGYFPRKAVPLAPSPDLCLSGDTDWAEIRFAEVMLNLAECANMVAGNQSTAYSMLQAIRQRAGITPGTNGLYGLKANMTTDEMVTALMTERQIELAFEGKRFWDLRRMRWLQKLSGTVRHGLSSTPVSVSDLSKGFTLKVFEVDLSKKNTLQYPLNYYFLPIDQTEIQKNPNLKQTDGWYEGGFNPLL